MPDTTSSLGDRTDKSADAPPSRIASAFNEIVRLREANHGALTALADLARMDAKLICETTAVVKRNKALIHDQVLLIKSLLAARTALKEPQVVAQNKPTTAETTDAAEAVNYTTSSESPYKLVLGVDESSPLAESFSKAVHAFLEQNKRLSGVMPSPVEPCYQIDMFDDVDEPSFIQSMCESIDAIIDDNTTPSIQPHSNTDSIVKRKTLTIKIPSFKTWFPDTSFIEALSIKALFNKLSSIDSHLKADTVGSKPLAAIKSRSKTDTVKKGKTSLAALRSKNNLRMVGIFLTIFIVGAIALHLAPKQPPPAPVPKISLRYMNARCSDSWGTDFDKPEDPPYE